MEHSVEVILGLITVIVTLGTILWQLSATLTGLRKEREEMSDEIEEMKKAIGDLKIALERLDKVPLHEQRIEQLERVVASQARQITTLWQKIFSVDKHVAVMRAVSEHDLDAADTDPPPPED